ncbi:MAG: hypothetical protein WCF26_10240 [Candidatus Sulfotelmatobacter sp.]|jgi:hypothetical protein
MFLANHHPPRQAIQPDVVKLFLLLIMHFLDVQKLPDEAKAIQASIGSYGPDAKLSH